MRNGVLKQVAELQQLCRKELGERWRSLFGTEPPAYSRDLLIGRLAYRVQELAFGGLAETTRNELRAHVPEDHLDTGAAEAARMDRRPRKNGIPVAGTRLIREWRGHRHEVTVVQGVCAAYAIDRAHVRGKGATAAGISTGYALYREGKPRLIVGSPGFGFVHGPYQYGTSVSEWGLTAEEAAWAPRFGLPAKLGSTELRFERHYDAEVFAMLAKREIPHSRIKASSATGLVGAIVVDDEGRLHVTQDPRRGGLAKAV